jgi:hypothetical protein
MKDSHKLPLVAAVLLLGLTSAPLSAISPSAVMVYGATNGSRFSCGPPVRRTIRRSASCGGRPGHTTSPRQSIPNCGRA